MDMIIRRVRINDDQALMDIGIDHGRIVAIEETIDKAGDCAKYLTIPQRDGFQQAVEGSTR